MFQFVLRFCYVNMAIIHAMGKVEFTILANEFGISHVIKKSLCVMFGLQPNIVHISKDDAYDDNYNVTE